MKHCLDSSWLNAAPLEFKDAEGNNVDDPVKAAIEALGGDIAKKFTKLEGDLKAANDRLDQEIARRNRPDTDKKDGEPTLESKAFEKFLRKGREALTPDEVKALSVSDDTQGGVLSPAEFLTELLRNVRLYSPIRTVARVAATSAPSVTLPKRTSGPTASWVGEREDRPEANVAFGSQNYPVAEIACWIDVSNQILEDSAFDINALLAYELSEEFGAAEGSAFVTGDGVKRPMGFMSDTSIGYTPGTDASLIKADGLIDLYHAIKPAYRQSAVWGMNGATLAAVRKLKDGTSGQYLLMTEAIGNSPTTTLLGKPVLELPDMPDIGAGNFPVIFGDFSQGYRIFDRVALSILRDPYSQASKGMTRFHARRRVAGGVGKAEALRKLKISTT